MFVLVRVTHVPQHLVEFVRLAVDLTILEVGPILAARTLVPYLADHVPVSRVHPYVLEPTLVQITHHVFSESSCVTTRNHLAVSLNRCDERGGKAFFVSSVVSRLRHDVIALIRRDQYLVILIS